MAKEKKGKKIAKQLQLNKSKALRCVQEMAKQSKKEKRVFVGIPCIHRIWKAYGDTAIKAWRNNEKKLLNKENE